VCRGVSPGQKNIATFFIHRYIFFAFRKIFYSSNKSRKEKLMLLPLVREGCCQREKQRLKKGAFHINLKSAFERKN